VFLLRTEQRTATTEQPTETFDALTGFYLKGRGTIRASKKIGLKLNKEFYLIDSRVDFK